MKILVSYPNGTVDEGVLAQPVDTEWLRRSLSVDEHLAFPLDRGQTLIVATARVQAVLLIEEQP